MRRHRHRLGSLACLLAAAVAMAGCSSSCARSRAPRERGELTEVEKATIAAFTSGTISRESPIRVAFHEPLARPEQVGAPLSPSPFRFEPAIAGTAVWAAPDRIEFRPKDRLPDGQAYAARLDLALALPGRQGAARALRVRVRDDAPVVRRQHRRARGFGRLGRQAPDPRRPAADGRRRGRARGREAAQGRARRPRAAGRLGPRPRPPRALVERLGDRARRSGLGRARQLGRRPRSASRRRTART